MNEEKEKEQIAPKEEESTPEPTSRLRGKEKSTEKEPEDFDENDKIRVLMNIPSSMKEKLRREAYKRDVSRATIVREALQEYFAKLENIEKHNPNKTKEINKIKQIIRESTNWFGGFDLEQFLQKIQEEELVGDEIWTEELLEAFLIPKIREASKGILSDSLEENCNLCIETLQLGEDNARFLAEKLGLEYSEEEAEATEEPFKLM